MVAHPEGQQNFTHTKFDTEFRLHLKRTQPAYVILHGQITGEARK